MQPDFQRPSLQGLKRSCWMCPLNPTHHIDLKLQNEPLFICANEWLNALLPLYFGLFLKLALQLSDTMFCISHDSVFLWQQNQLFPIWIIMLNPLGLLHISWSFFQNLPFPLKLASVYCHCVFWLSWYKRCIFLALFLLMMNHLPEYFLILHVLILIQHRHFSAVHFFPRQ